MNNTAVDVYNPVELRKAGIDALTKELGPLGMTLFLRQFEIGHGDYTKERDELLDGITIEDIEREIDFKHNA